MKILVATANRHKVEEIGEILRDYAVELVDLRAFPAVAPPAETGSTYYENALLKARFYSAHTGLPALADDSGLEVDALDGAPGLYSARFGSETMPHSEKIQLVLRLLGERPERERSARFRCCCVLVFPDRDTVLSCEETCEGTIAFEPAGGGGFGYDPIFLVAGGPRTMAELSSEEKHAVSHRGRSLRGLFQQLSAPTQS